MHVSYLIHFTNFICFYITATEMMQFWRHVMLAKVSSSFRW